MFNKYMHLEKYGSDHVDGINMGIVHVFPKLDGTNASVWMTDGEIRAGSRNRQLSLEADNAGFYAWVMQHKSMFEPYFAKNPDHIIFGEWLVPHSLKTYKDDAWNEFYAFDVGVLRGGEIDYIPFDEYKGDLDAHGITFLSPFAVIRNGTDEQFRKLTEKNVFFIKDGAGVGEGIVLKNYDFRNRFRRTVWAKIITNEFKGLHIEQMGASLTSHVSLEEKIAQEVITKHIVDKAYAKIENSSEKPWSSHQIPRLLGMVFHDFVTEEIWDVLKRHKNPTLDFKFLRNLINQQVKTVKPELF